MGDNHRLDRTDVLDRRSFVKASAALGAVVATGASISSPVGALECEADVDGEPVIYQYFHTEWTEVEASVDLLDEAGVTAVWLPQPALGKLDWDDLASDGEYGFYDDERSPFGWRDPHPPIGYQPVDLREFDSALGTEAELESLIETLHDRGIDVVLDTVLNHVANPDAPEEPWGGELEWPQFETEEHFTVVPYHDYRGEIRDPQYDEPLLSLPNLDTLHPEVQAAHVDYLTKIADLGADGVRFDAAAHVWPEYFEEIINPLCDDLGLWRVGEVWDESDPGSLLEYVDTGMDVYDFPLYATLSDAIESGDLSGLHADSGAGVVHEDPDAAVTFVQNHDTVGPGVEPDQPEGHEVDLANAFVLSYPGTPHLYRSGVRGDGPTDLEDADLQTLVWVKTNLASGALIDRYAGTETYVYEREENLLAGISVADSDRTLEVETSWSDVVLTDHTDHGDDLEVGEDRTVELTVPAEGWVMYAPDDGATPPEPEPSIGFADPTVSVAEGETVDADVTASAGEEALSSDVELSLEGEPEASVHVDLEPEESTTVSLPVESADLAVGEYDLAVTFAGQEDEATLVVEDDSALEGTYVIENALSGKVLDVEGIENEDDGANVQQWTDAGGDDQRWEITEDGDAFVVENGATGKVLEVADFGTEDGENVQQWEDAGEDSQRWQISEHGESYVLTNVLSGNVLEVADFGTHDGANVRQWEDVGEDSQRWYLNDT
ncbi:RICIN domain-containing protein [Natrarchaeobius sp. A-rgal3]|uniref:RICIN domain-containing protein n=1 Tax=Natrarchaeobius versutus TaxID=1679078 RepID=UPI00350EA6C2